MLRALRIQCSTTLTSSLQARLHHTVVPIRPDPSQKRRYKNKFPYRQMSSSSYNMHQNRLANAKSPYLLQHADNPVDWYEWSEEAFEVAAKENKPIFLSVGYSACHWCHVLAHESFEDPEIAGIMNESFVNIKVDREERPDVDRLYMTFVQATNGRGGWPMSVWLTPELAPFFAGMYFPREAFKVFCERIHSTWEEDSSKVRGTGAAVIEQLKQMATMAPTAPGPEINIDQALRKVFEKWRADYDPIHAGFGAAPKFPSPSMIFYPLLRYAYYADNQEDKKTAVNMASKSILAIAHGGITDHVGKGVARYSVDAEWRLPHFEKMLYDQAQLTYAALECSSIVEDSNLKRELQKFAMDIIEYTCRDLRHPDGAFYSAEDADSLPSESAVHATEGAFYVWEKATLDEILGENAPLFENYFGVKEGGNIDPKNDLHNELAGENQLYASMPLAELASKHNMSLSDATGVINDCLAELKAHRDANRPRPHLDDKVVTAWNGLMLSALARAASILEDDLTFPDGANAVAKSIEMADAVVRFTKQHLWDEERRQLCRSWRNGRGPAGMCEDYAAMIAGLIDMYEATGHEDHLIFAFELQQRQDDLFWDDEHGGYFASPAGDARILVRLKDTQDGAEPSALSVSLSNLYRLSSFITSNEYDLRSKAERTLSSQGQMIQRAPHALGMMIAAAEMGSRGMKEVIVTGSSRDNSTKAILKYVRSRFVPNRSLIFIDPDAPPSWLANHNQVVRGLVDNLASKTTASMELPEARICERGVCGLPLRGVELELVLR